MQEQLLSSDTPTAISTETPNPTATKQPTYTPKPATNSLVDWKMVLDHDEYIALGFRKSYSYGVTKMVPFQGSLYAYAGSDGGGKILRSQDGEIWEALTDPGYGFGSAYTSGWDMIAFDDMLYISVGSLLDSVVPHYFARSADGEKWDPVLTFAHDEDTPDYTADKFGLFKGMLYGTTVNPGQIWRSATGDFDDWELVAELGEAVSRTSKLVEFNGYIYMLYSEGPSTSTMTLLRSENGMDWEAVPVEVADPWDFDDDLAVHQGYLYISTGNYDETWASLGGRIYRTSDAVRWEIITNDGFGDPSNHEIPGLISFHDYLYATVWPSFERGAQVWRSENGDPGTWEQVASGGWGDPNNNWTSVRNQQAVFNNELYIAGLSHYGPIWKMVGP
jgi:hypothetical protein